MCPWKITIEGFTKEQHINLVEISNYSDSLFSLILSLNQKYEEYLQYVIVYYV